MYNRKIGELSKIAYQLRKKIWYEDIRLENAGKYTSEYASDELGLIEAGVEGKDEVTYLQLDFIGGGSFGYIYYYFRYNLTKPESKFNFGIISPNFSAILKIYIQLDFSPLIDYWLYISGGGFVKLFHYFL